MTVTGELLRVNIETHHLVIRYPPTRTKIPCQFDPDVLGSVMRNYDVPIQVTGLYTLDRKGNPIELTGVTRVEPVDLTPMTFGRIEWSGRILRIDPPLSLAPTLDEESGQFFTVLDEELGIDVFARTRDDLAAELAEQLFFSWDTYATELDDRLSLDARRLRDRLRARLREDNRATRPHSD